MALGLFISSCSNDEPMHQDCNEAESEVVLRSVEEAVELAEKLNEVRFANMGTRSQEKNIKGVEIISSLNSRSGSDTLIYAINYDGNEGFTLISAAKRGIAVIGYADEGNFDEDGAKENPNFSYYLGEAKEYVNNQLSIGGPIVSPSFPETLMQSIFVKNDLKWGQRYPEGIYCPNGIVGCAQTAMAIIMANRAEPSSINLTYPERDVNSVTFDWSEIRKHKQSATSSTHLNLCDASEEIHKNIGRLCRELGYRNKAVYNTNSTSTSPSIVVPTFRAVCPALTITDYKSFNSTYSNLWDDMYVSDGVAYLVGYDINGEGGHAWVCDGADHYDTSYKVLKVDGTYETVHEHEYYYHFNWGWRGDDNGYFAAGVFDTSKGKPKSRYDFSSGTKYFVVSK